MSKQVALVTGGTRGIGLGIARQLAEQGFNLALNGMRPEEQVKEVLDELRGMGADVLYVPGDIGSTEAREAMIEAVRERFGALNWLVNNAGVAPRERLDILETTEESFDFVVGTNLKGGFFLSQLAAIWMVAQKKADASFTGGIINVSSISATVVSVNRGEY